MFFWNCRGDISMIKWLFFLVWRKWFNPGDRIVRVDSWRSCVKETKLGDQIHCTMVFSWEKVLSERLAKIQQLRKNRTFCRNSIRTKLLRYIRILSGIRPGDMRPFWYAILAFVLRGDLSTIRWHLSKEHRDRWNKWTRGEV